MLSQSRSPAPVAGQREEPLLVVDRLHVGQASTEPPRAILRGVELTMEPGARLGVVGESGSGKSMTASAIIGLLPDGVTVTGGRIVLQGRDLTAMDEPELRRVRGRDVSVVYQNAVSSLNPLVRVGEQIANVARAHSGLSRRDARDRAVSMLEALGIPDPARRARDYPHQFSGGMAQRVAIATALVSSPALLIADEPTTGLDATVQAQVLEVIDAAAADVGVGLLLISHDLGVIQATCDVVAVMYAGVVLERGRREDIVSTPLSPYTQGLVKCFEPSREDIEFIPGRVPEPEEFGASCPFADRCHLVSERCRREPPQLRELRPGHWVACHNA